MAEKFLFKQLKINDAASPYNNKRVDVLIDKGVIKRIGKDLRATKAVSIDAKGWHAVPGFCDLYANFCDPGFEHREDIRTGVRAAAAGGYTTVCVIPSTNPVIQSKSGVEYIIHKSEGLGVDVYPYGAVSENLEGEQPTEMYDMQHAGAVGFTDAPQPVRNSGLLLRALQYVQPFDGIVFDMSTDGSLSNDAHISEGDVSVRMGLKGIPHMAEVIQLKRNIEVLRYTGSRMHIFGITTKEGVDLVRQAKKEGLRLTASAFVHHLLFTDKDVANYNSNLKSKPPFRTERDRKALLKGLQQGVIDCIVTQHSPLEIEEKKTEFEYAGFGMTGLETAFSMAMSSLGNEKGKPDWPAFVNWFSRNPRRILGLDEIIIREGAKAEMAFIDPKSSWTYDSASRKSKSSNSPMLNKTLQGAVMGIFNQGKWIPNE